MRFKNKNENKKPTEMQPYLGDREGKNGSFQAENVMKISEVLFCVVFWLKKISFPDEKRPKRTVFYLNIENVMDFLSPPNRIISD